MSKSFLPTSDAALLAWSLNFSTLISRNADRLWPHLDAGDRVCRIAHELCNRAGGGDAIRPYARNKPAVATKNTAR